MPISQVRNLRAGKQGQAEGCRLVVAGASFQKQGRLALTLQSLQHIPVVQKIISKHLKLGGRVLKALVPAGHLRPQQISNFRLWRLRAVASAVLRDGCHASAPPALPAGLELPPTCSGQGIDPESLTIPLRAHSPSKTWPKPRGRIQPMTSGSRPPHPFLPRRTAWSRATWLPPLQRSSAPGSLGSTQQHSSAKPNTQLSGPFCTDEPQSHPSISERAKRMTRLRLVISP